MNFLNAIREEELSAFSMEILDYFEKVADLLDNTDKEMNSLAPYFQEASYGVLMERYDNFRGNYVAIKDNIKSYSEELITLMQRMKENDHYLAQMFANYTSEKKLEAKKVKGDDL